MNNVWTAIAFSAPCATRYAPRKPLLQLFNGYTRNQSTKAFQLTSCRRRDWSSGLRSTSRGEYAREWRSCYTTSAVLSSKSRTKQKQLKAVPKHTKPAPAPAQKVAPANDSKLESAPVVASHTEGAPEAEEPLTWRDYDPEGGMPLPEGERTQPQINSIFGSEELDADTGNYILSVMQWRRMSGALIDKGLDFAKDSGVSREQALRGLEYVRTLDPGFEEQAAGQTWAEEESLRLQEEIQERAFKLRLYKREEGPEEAPPEMANEPDQGTEYGRDRNQDSALIRLREANKARNQREEGERITAQERAETAALQRHRGPLQLAGGVQPPTELQITPSGGISITRPQQKAWLQPVERKPWVKYYEERAQIIKDNSIPQLSLLRRLGPSLLMLLTVLGLCIFLSDNYTPPPKSARMWPDTPPAIATLAGITGILTLSFIASRLPPLWRTYSKYFCIVPAYPYSLSLIGGIFRHDTVSHLLTNTASLWLFGLLLHEDVGRGTFLSMFIFCGAFGGYTSLVYNIFRSNWTAYMFGSSGAVLGVLAAACALRPNGTIRVWGNDVPIAAWVFLLLYGTAEAVAAVRMRRSHIDHAGHLGGMVAGFAAALWVKRRAAQQNPGGEMRAVPPGEEGKLLEAVVAAS